MPAPAWYLTLGVFINRFGSFVILFLVLYLTSMGFTASQAGTAVAAYGVGELLASGLGGDMADRIGRRGTIIASMLVSSASLIVLSQLTAYPAILATTFVVGCSSEMFRPASAALIADLVPEGQRVTAFAVLRLVSNIGFAAGSALAAFLVSRSFQWLFAADAGTSAIFALIAVLALPDDPPRERAARERASSGYRALFRDGPFMLLVGSAALITFVYYQQLYALPLRVVNHLGYSKADFGLLLTINGALVVLLELPISSLTMHRNPRRMLALGFLLVGVGYALTGAATTLPMLAGTVVIWSFGEMIGAPVSYSYVADLAPPGAGGRYQGVFGVAWGTGAITGPALGGLILAANPMLFWPLLGLVGALAAAMVAAVRPRRWTEGT
ncbi:MAG TPA: MFS transporter, partial [Actinomycetota bacterium]|nr:MFS transporter [Actinomycetota bacterium]